MSDRPVRCVSEASPAPRTSPLTPAALAALLALASLSLPARPARAQPEAAHVVPGDITLEIASTLPSSLDIDTQSLEEVLCDKFDSNGGGAGEVGLTISNDGTSGCIVQVLEVASGLQADTARVSAGGLHWPGGRPVATSCGRWSFAVTLDPDAVQPPSNLILGRATRSEPTAPFAGIVGVAARFRFSALEDGRTRELPVHLRLAIAGRWTVAGNADGSLPAPLTNRDSNLVLLVDQEGNEWAPLPAIVLVGCDGRLCPAEGSWLALQAGSRAVAALRAAR